MNNITILVALITALGAAIPAMAKEAQSPEVDSALTEQAAQSPLRLSVSAGGSGQTEADIDSGGSFSLYHLNSGFTAPIRLDEISVLRSSIKYDFASYDFSDIPAPWENIHTFSFVSIYEWEGNGSWSYYAGGLVRVAAESGADAVDATTGGGLTGATYEYSDTLTLGAGLLGMSQIEEDATVVPLITAKWKFADDWRLKLGLNDVATGGYGVAAIWNMAPEWVFSFGGNMHKSRFRIDGTDVTRNGVGQESSVLLYTDATYHATSDVDVTGYLGTVGGGELQIEGSSGHEIYKKDYDPALLLGVKVTVKL